MGVQSIALTKDGEHIIAGAGNGVVALLSRSKLELVRRVQFEGEKENEAQPKGKRGGLLLRQKKSGSKINPSITSIALNRAGDHFFVGTNKSTMYLVALNDFDYELRNSAHYNRINDVVFPHSYGDLFITA